MPWQGGAQVSLKATLDVPSQGNTAAPQGIKVEGSFQDFFPCVHLPPGS